MKEYSLPNWQGNYVSLALQRNDIEACSHSGSCDEDVAVTVRKAYVRKQLDAMKPASVASELREYGAWDEDELRDDAANARRLVWIAAGNLSDELCLAEGAR